jgi:hypothetical protein
MNKIENGTQAILGNDCSPTAKELIVFPKSLNFTIAKPMPTPKTIEIENPIKRRHIVIAMLVSNEKFSSAKDCATIAGDGKATLGHIPRMNVSCQIPTNTARNSIVLAISLRLILLFFFFLVFSSMEYFRDSNFAIFSYFIIKIQFSRFLCSQPSF